MSDRTREAVELEIWRETVTEQKDFRRRKVVLDAEAYRSVVNLLLQYIDYLEEQVKP